MSPLMLMKKIILKFILKVKNFLFFLRQRKEWLDKGGRIDSNFIVLGDYEEKSGSASGHYFHQDLLIANRIYRDSPKRHIDIGSRVDGFVAHVASFREIEILDIRPLENKSHKNIKFIQADLMRPKNIGKTDSLSCLHAIEHFGLGRYTDPIDVNGHVKGINNLINLVSKGGRLYISFPIGKKDAVAFNAHRIFHPLTIFNIPSIKSFMNLEQFDYVDDFGNLHLDIDLKNFENKLTYGCGIYTFIKIK